MGKLLSCLAGLSALLFSCSPVDIKPDYPMNLIIGLNENNSAMQARITDIDGIKRVRYRINRIENGNRELIEDKTLNITARFNVTITLPIASSGTYEIDVDAWDGYERFYDGRPQRMTVRIE